MAEPKRINQQNEEANTTTPVTVPIKDDDENIEQGGKMMS